MRIRVRVLVGALVLAISVASAQGASRLAPLVLGWEQFFKLDWQGDQRKGRPIVSGHILNDWGMPAVNVRLLVDSLDAGGQVVGQRVEWLGGELTPGTRRYFEVPAPAASPSYRVSVFAFDWLQFGGGVDIP